MSESPVLARGSKTATVVVVVVFLQLLVIAVLGLGAITRDRREGVREAQERADAEAVAAAEDNLRRVEAGLTEEFDRMVEIQQPAELRINRALPHVQMLDAAYQVEGSGTIWWFTGRTRLWLAQVDIERIDQLALQGEDGAAREEARLVAARERNDHAGAVSALWNLLTSHWLALDDAPDVWPPGCPRGAQWARTLVAEFLGGGGTDQGSLTTDAVLLKALEVEAVSRGRTDHAMREWGAELDAIAKTIHEALECDPRGEEYVALVDAFHHAAALLEPLRPVVQQTAEKVRRMPDAGRRPARLLDVGGELFVTALANPDVYANRVIVARLKPDEVKRIAAARVDQAGLALRGVRLEIARGPGAFDGRSLATWDLARLGHFELPFRAALFRDAPAALPTGGPAETFYLGIIGLAALGLVGGGVVLVRMWRREVHLARLKADFVSNLSHELKTPLTSISLFTEMLQEGKLESEEERREGLAVLAQESQRLQRIVTRMIDVARREARGTPYDLHPGDLNAPIRDAALRFRRIVTEPGLDLVVALAPEPLPVRMDAAAVDDAVTNLLSNAWKYKRGDRARIEVRTRRRGRRAEITVSDDGIGIPRHERKRVFEMFYRAENLLTQSVAGTGLGLALVRTIVRAHRGRIRIEGGRSGVGSTFRLRLPLARRALAAARADAPGADAPAPAPNRLPASGSPRAPSTP